MKEIVADINFQECALSYYGFDGGNPSSNIWFCGIEPGGNLNEFNEVKDIPFVERANIESHLKDQYSLKISKILTSYLEISPTEKYYKIFKDNGYFDKNGIGFKMNMFPLSFPKDKELYWDKKIIQKTGFPNKNIYKQWCRIKRFPFLRNHLVHHYKPEIVICTGLAYLNDYIDLFLNKECCSISYEIIENERKQLYIYKITGNLKTRVFVIPFLGQGGIMKDEDLMKIGKIVKT